MKREQIITKARSAIGHGTLYRLGAGAPHVAPFPWDEVGACDCSGFVCWVLGISRYQPLLSFLKPVNGGWMNTDGMVADSLSPSGFFEHIPYQNRQPGDLIVYPSRWYAKKILDTPRMGSSPRIGHVGIVSGPDLVIHCSAGNFRTYTDAIAETDTRVFDSVPYHRFIRFCGVE